jgi:polysaccharide biosynthesis transport protein
MSLAYFIKLLLKNLLWLIMIPTVMAGSIFYFTRKEVKVYSSESVIYTGIASGYNLNGSNKADFFATTNAFDNLLSLINSRETKKEVCIDLLASHLSIVKHDPLLISWGAYSELKTLVPDSIRRIVVKPTTEATIAALEAYLGSSEGNLIYSIINSSNPYYSLSALDNIKANRINNSDLIKIAYQTNDPIICKQTLELLEESFIKKHRRLKQGQSESVVDYFEAQTKNANKKLNAAEEGFMEFNKQNDIINYYEQTKAVAGERENLFAQNHNLEMDNMASNKSLAKVNESMRGRLYQNEYGAAILKEKEELAGINNKIAVAEIIGKNTVGYQQQMDSLRMLSTALDKKLQASVTNLYTQTNTPYGIPTQNVLNEWLKNTLEYEQGKARLAVMDKRKKEFVEEYRKYAPLGATLKKIERQINVSEQEYMEMLHGLNIAQLNQQNNELTTKMNIVDAPYLPLKANASKRMILVVVGFLVGFILVLTVILARALINKTLQNSEKAARLVGIPYLGLYPLNNSNAAFLAKSSLRLAQQLLSNIDPAKQPVSIGFISVQNKEGKSTLMNIFFEELTKLNYTVEKQVWNKDLTLLHSEKEFLLIEFPPLDTLVIKPSSLPPLHQTILVCRANRIWSKIDKQLLALFCKTTTNKPVLLLNGVNPDFAEEFVGEVPRKRSFFRTLFKRLIKFEFGNRKKIR